MSRLWLIIYVDDFLFFFRLACLLASLFFDLDQLSDVLICYICRALAAAVAVVPAAAARAEDASGVASSRMSYSRFLEYLDMGRVKKVRLSVCCGVLWCFAYW